MRLKELFRGITGYWVHKADTLPVGVDLIFDMQHRLKIAKLGTIFDVGANEGQTYRWMRQMMPEAKIFSFEPVDSVFNKLMSAMHGDLRGVAEKIAFGEKSGTKVIRLHNDFSVLNSLKDDLMSSSAHAREENVVIDTIDEYCEKHRISRIEMLKIDTEGYELNVLKGAEKMLDHGSVDTVLCEVGFQRCNKRNTNFSDIADFLEPKGYYFFGLYQLGDYDWIGGNLFGNALFVSTSVGNKNL